MSYKRKQLSESIKKNQYPIVFFSILTIIFVILMGSNLGFYSPIVEGDQKVYLLSGDVIKNFQFDSFDNQPISIAGNSQDRKMTFETKPVWRIDKNDIWLTSISTDGDDVYIRYKVAMTNKINMFTSIDLKDAVEPYPTFPDDSEPTNPTGYKDPMIIGYKTDSNGLKKATESFLVASYRHSGLFGDRMFGWEAYLTWQHYNFGDIKDWNERVNDFEGEVVMSFDIAQSPLPNFNTQSGDSLTKNFDYIAVSSVAVVDNVIGKLNLQAPDIVGLTPSEHDASQNTKSAVDSFGGTANNKWDATYDPNPRLVINQAVNSFDGGISPQSKGSTMNPRRKDGGLIWNPEQEQKSMTDVKFIYNIGSISPIVSEYTATLSYNYKYYETIDEPFWQIGTKRNEDRSYSHTRSVALHVTNRYIQSEIRVVFDIFTSYKIDVGGDGIEDYTLDFPMEYYDLLTWITTVDGFGGGTQHTETIGLDWLLNPFGIGSGTIILIVVVIIVILVLFITLKFGMKWYQARQTRKMVESALQRK